MFNITSHYPAIAAVIFIPVSIFLAVFFYRKSSLQGFKKHLLTGIKSLAIFLILVLLLEPSLLSYIKNTNGRTGIVLIDNTRSMNLPGSTAAFKKDEINTFLKNNFSSDEYRYFTFSNDNIKKIQSSEFDSLRYDGFATDPSTALLNLKKLFPENKFSSVLLISDGIFNAGGNPLYNAKLFGCPFIMVSIGDTVQKKDIVIDRVFYNEKALTETVNPIKVLVSTYDIPRGTINVNLLREGTVILTKTINAENTQHTSEVNFDVTENKPGIVRYKVTAESVPGEITYKNNDQEFLVDYTENKINLLYVSGGPGYDNAFLTDILKRVKNYHTILKTAKNANEFYEGPIEYKSFGELSAVIIQGFPTAQSGTELISSLSSKVRENNIPVIFFTERNTDYKKLDLFDEFIPFSISRISSDENLFSMRVVSTTGNEMKDVLNDVESAPQIFRNVNGIQQKPGSEVLMTDRSSGEPILITRNSGKVRSAGFLGYGLWRWRLNERKDYEEIAEKFIIGIVNSTISKEKKTKFLVYPEKNIFDYTENVKLLAEVYDENFTPIRNAIITGKISSNGRTVKENIPFSLFNNRYEADVTPLPPGDYSIEAQAELDNSFYSKGDSRFLSDTLNTEYLVTRSNFESMRSLPDNTNGRFFSLPADPKEVAEYISSIENQNISGNETGTVKHSNLWENKYVMLVIIGLFSVEWYLRKRYNLP